MLLHLQAMSCPAGAVVLWRAPKKHMRLPLPLDPPLFYFFSYFSALNYTPNLMKRKPTNTRYFLFFCRWTFTPRSFFAGIVSGIFPLPDVAPSLRFFGTVEVEKLLILNSRTNQLSLCQSQWARRDRGSWAPKIVASSDCIYQHCCLPNMALKLKPSAVCELQSPHGVL